MAKPLKPLVRGSGYYPSKRLTPLVYSGGYTTKTEEETPEDPTSNKVGTGQVDYMKLKS